MNTQNTPTAETVPDLEHEPALTIGQLFADKAKLKTLVTAVVGVLVVLGVNVTPGIEDNIVTILNALVPLVLAAIGYGAMTTQAKEQAIETRDRVYAPATVEQITGTRLPDDDVTATLRRS